MRALAKPLVKRKKVKSVVAKQGDSVTPSISKNCLNCKRWTFCLDPRKKFSYACSRWGKLPELELGYSKEEIVAPDRDDDEAFDPQDFIEKVKNKNTQELDLEKLVIDALEANMNVPPDLRIDDRDLKQAPNFRTWMSKKKYAGSSEFYLWPRQVQISTQFLGEYCPRCSDVDFLEAVQVNTPVAEIDDRVTYLRYGRCPKCKVGKSELICEEELNEYYALSAVVGQRGSKTFLSTMIESYNQHRWLKLPNPQLQYGVAQQQVLTGTYVSLTFNQARENYWEPLNGFFSDSQWFRSYHALLDYYGERYGEELYDHKDTFLRYRHKKIMLHPSGPNKRTLRGRTRTSASIDEAGWFPVSDGTEGMERMAGGEVHEALDRSLMTIRAAHTRLVENGYDNFPKPTFINISSPSEVNDLIMRLYRSSQGSKTHYGIKLPTWEMNPNITRSDLNDAFARDERKAMRDFGAEPPLSSNAWISELSNVSPIFKGRQNNIRVKQYQFKSKSGIRQTAGIATIKQKSNGGRVMAIDAGYVGNSFSFGVGKLVEGEPVIEGMGEIIPQKGSPISFARIYEEALLPVIRESGVQVVISDRWQNIKMLQDMEDETGILPVEYRVKYVDFEDLREAIYNETITLPRLELKPEQAIEVNSDDYPNAFMRNPMSHLLYQCLTVRDYPGTSVEKGTGATDDLFRVLVLLHYALTESEIAGILRDGNTRPQRALGLVTAMTGAGVNSSNLGVSGGRSSGAGAATSANVSSKAGAAGSRS